MLSLATGLLLIAENKDEKSLDNPNETPINGNKAIAAANILTLIISVSIKHLLKKYKKAAQKYMPEKLQLQAQKAILLNTLK